MRLGPENNNWRGGRSVASNGYMLVRVPGHPMADVRGYVYEHRLVASEKIGRLLREGEEVHHLNGDKLDNRPENVVVVSAAEHRVHHRREGSNRRLPGQGNDVIACECGCGTTFPKFDRSGRPRRFVTGHNGVRGIGGRWG